MKNVKSKYHESFDLMQKLTHRRPASRRTVSLLLMCLLLLSALAVRAQDGDGAGGERWLNLPPDSPAETDPVDVPATPTELLVNGSFENGGAQARNPRVWQFAGARQPGDRRVCNTDGSRPHIATDQACAMRLMSAARFTRSLNQTQRFATPLGQTGDTLALSADVRAKTLRPGMTLRAILTYTDGTRQTLNIAVTRGSFPYTAFSDQVTLRGPLRAVRVRIMMNDARGTAWVDNVRLTHVPFSLPPQVIATTPVDGAMDVLPGSSISITFSKPVIAAPDAFALACPDATAIPFTASSLNGLTHMLTPSQPLPASTICVVTVRASGITDLGSGETMMDDYTFSFTTIAPDAPPTLLSISPPDGATDVAWDTALVFTFSEPVTVQPGWLTLTCTRAGQPDTVIDVNSVTGAGNATLTVQPGTQLPVGALCTGTVNGGLVSDADLNDPPDTMVETVTFSFTTLDLAPQPSDDAFTVAPNIGINVPAPGVLANDDLNQGQIVAPTPGVPFQTALGGTVRLRADGGFTYDPPAGARAINDEFVYTIDNGSAISSARVTLTVQDGAAVWFIDAVAEAGGTGTLRAPFASIAAYNAVAGGTIVRAGDMVYLHSGNYHGQGLILKNNQAVIGQGADLTALLPPLPEHSRALPVPGPRPQISTFFGAGVLLAQNNTLRGFNIGSTATYDITGFNVGALTVRDVALNAGGGALNVSGSGVLDIVLDSVHGNGSGALNLVNTTGTLTILNGTLTSAGGSVIIVRGGTPVIQYAGSIASVGEGALLDVANTTGGYIHLHDGELLAVGSAVTLNNAADVRLSNMQLTRRTPIFDSDLDDVADQPNAASGIAAVNSTVRLNNVTVSGFFGPGADLRFSGGSTARIVRVVNSTFNDMSGGVQVQATNGAQVCAQIAQNSISGGGTGIGLTAGDGSPSLRLVGYTGAASNIPAISNLLTTQNTLNDASVQVTITSGEISGVAECGG